MLFWVSKSHHLAQQERHVGFRRQIYSDFGMILRAHFERFLGLDKSNSVFLLGRVSRSLFASILNGIIDSWSSENRVFLRNILQNDVSNKKFFSDSRVVLLCFFDALGIVFLIFLLWKQA